MAIDDPIDAHRKQYEGQAKSPVDLILLTGKLTIAPASPFFEILSKVYDRLTRASTQERAAATWELLVNELKYLDAKIDQISSLKVDKDDLQETIQLVIRRDAEEFNDRKRDLYVKIVGSAVHSEVRIKDLASFIQDVEQMGESDLRALKTMNAVMNKPGDWKDQSGKERKVLHPTTFISRRQELAREIAKAFGMDTGPDENSATFSHEEGYEACARLQGFGLAHEVELSPRQVPIGEYCFHVSKRGLMLLKLIGEDVANWEHYFPHDKSSFVTA